MALLSAEQVRAQDDPLALADGQGDAAQFASISFLDNAELPPAIGQPDFAVYIEETGHTLGDVFLDYWRATGEDAMFGPPISEPFAASDGYYSQVFERGVLQYLPEHGLDRRAIRAADADRPPPHRRAFQRTRGSCRWQAPRQREPLSRHAPARAG